MVSIADWAVDRTAVYSPAHQTTWIMVTREDGAGDRTVLFGRIDRELRPLPWGVGTPYASALIVEPSGTLLAVVKVRYGRGDRLSFVRLRSDDAGQTWSEPIPFTSNRAVAAELRLHADESGVLHMIWRDGLTAMRHLYQDPAKRSWTTSEIPEHPGDVQSFAGVSGIDRCGRLVIVREAQTPEGQLVLRTLRWTGSGWIEDPRLSGRSGIQLFDGRGRDGTWYVAWSGPPAEGSATDPDMRLWLADP